MNQDSDERVALIGLGNLGRSIGLNLLERGWKVSAFDRDRSRVDELVRQGATAVVDVAELARSRYLCFAVPDDRAVRSVLESGLLTELTPEHVVLVNSTVLPERARELAALLDAEAGAAYLDVPVSGGAERARAGTLTLFVGGPEAAVAQAEKLLADIGDQRFVLGAVGTASATKLANQLILFASVGAVHEALRLTSAYGVEESAVLTAVNTGLGDTWAGRNWGFFDALASDYDEAGVALVERPWFKDLHEVVDAAESVAIDVPLARLLADVVPSVIEQHAGDRAAKEGTTR